MEGVHSLCLFVDMSLIVKHQFLFLVLVPLKVPSSGSLQIILLLSNLCVITFKVIVPMLYIEVGYLFIYFEKDLQYIHSKVHYGT